MDQKNRDQQQKDGERDPREMSQDRNRDPGKDRNEEETGEPIQLDKDGKEHQGGKQHQGEQPQKPESERMPEQGRPAQR